MAIKDTFTRKLKKVLHRKMTFILVYDALDENFDGGAVKVTAMALDLTQRESFKIPIGEFNFTANERSALEALFQSKINAMLANTKFTIDDTPDSERPPGV